MEFVYAFDEQAPGGRELLGGKGIGLAEMTALGVPVPAGFTVTTDACREVMRSGDVPDDLWRQVDTHVGYLGVNVSMVVAVADGAILNATYRPR